MSADATYDLNWITSVDDHIIEPPDLWVTRVPAKYKDVAPRVITEDDGSEHWVYEDVKNMTGGLGASAGRKPEDITAVGFPYSEMRPGCYDAQARLEDMDKGNILASLNFPSLPRFCGQLFPERKNMELSKLCVAAYNDWMVDEWCGDSGGRLIPLCIVPLWNVELAAAEIRRNAARGAPGRARA